MKTQSTPVAAINADPIYESDVSAATPIPMVEGATTMLLSVYGADKAVRYLISNDATTPPAGLANGIPFSSAEGAVGFPLARGQVLWVIDDGSGAVVCGQFLTSVNL